MTSPFMRAAGFGSKKKMVWKKLLRNKCPDWDCRGVLEKNDWSDVYTCNWCDFVITESRFVDLCRKIREEAEEKENGEFAKGES